MNTIPPCPDWRERLSAYHDEQLTPEEKAQVDAHLADCEACHAALAQWEQDRRRFTAAYAASTGTDIRAHVLQELRTMEQQQPTQNITLPLTWLRWLAGFSAAAVVLCLALTVVVLLSRQPQTRVVVAGGASHNQEVTDNEETYSGYKYAPAMPSGISNGLSGNRARHSRALKMPKGASYDEKYAGEYSRNPLGDVLSARVDATGKYEYVQKPDTYSIFRESERNYGIPGGIVMAYDADMRMLVKDALAGARKAQQMILDNGGFVVDFNYYAGENEIPAASIRGKVPAEKAEETFNNLEKMGRIRGLAIAGQDLTEQWKAQLDAITKENADAQRMGALANRSGSSRVSLDAQMQRHWAEMRATQARRALHGLAAKHDLVEFSAVFEEDHPRERIHFVQVTAITRQILHFALLLLGLLAVLLALGVVVAVPVVALRKLRRQEKPVE
ncbi:MAG: zf-HC2 domain-containing protein [Armatimonadota bacterium]